MEYKVSTFCKVYAYFMERYMYLETEIKVEDIQLKPDIGGMLSNIGNKPYNVQTCIKPSTVDEKQPTYI